VNNVNFTTKVQTSVWKMT